MCLPHGAFYISWGDKMRKQVFAILGSALLFGAASGGSTLSSDQCIKNVVNPELAQWKTFHSVPGKCTVALPEQPEHVRQVMPMPEDGYNLEYDVYVSAQEQKAVYMVLIAQYPPAIDMSYAESSLESFLNGILSQNPNNKLIFADLVEFNGHKALDFFIQTRGVYFKGRAIMANNNLYLLAMECETHNYKDEHFNHFIDSFNLSE